MGFAQQLVVSNRISHIDHIFLSSQLNANTPIMSSNADQLGTNTAADTHTDSDSHESAHANELHSPGHLNGMSDNEGMT